MDKKSQPAIEKYNPSVIEKKWQAVWEKEKIYSPNLDKAKKPFYNLMMFPYPSAEGMHVGNMYAFTGADVYGSFMRMKGFSVFEPIGLDGFGIHSENYALKTGRHPQKQAKISEVNFYRQLHATGNGFDWTRTVETYSSSYYKWTQWLFIQLFKAGLAYRKKAPVNFCPSCKTVLADEQVIEKSKIIPPTAGQKSKVTKEKVGVCERCESEVIKKELEQWFFKITKYADRLLNGLSHIDWVEKVKIAQKEWIGRSEGAIIKFEIAGPAARFPRSMSSADEPAGTQRVSTPVKQASSFVRSLRSRHPQCIDVFTTRPETTDGATFLVLSPQHPKAREFKSKKVKDYIRLSINKTDEERRKEKTGVFSGEYVINPLTKKKIPIWIADYVLMEYGTGAIMAVPAEDQRDREFAEKYKIPLEKTSLAAKPEGKKVVNYHLRDWLISRQRYWGPPIPMIDCPKCGWQPVPEEDLPVELPDVVDWKPLGTGKSPLANHPEFYKTRCPNCFGAAKRETDVSDTFLDSAWYFLRYLATEFNNIPFSSQKFSEYSENPVNQIVRKSDASDNQKRRSTEFSAAMRRSENWLPVSMYIGGAEHSVLHLLYARFITMVLHDLGFIDFDEPFTRFYAHGLLIKEGAKMSKSKGNIVVPDAYIKKFGADTLRCYLMFTGPFNLGGDFRDSGIEGMHRFLKRVWKLVSKSQISSRQRRDKSQISNNGLRMMHQTIKGITDDLENLRYNTAIAKLMTYYNFLASQKSVLREEMEALVLLLAPFAPHMTEELWQQFFINSKFQSIHLHSFPPYDPKLLEKDKVTIVVQVNGKTRDTVKSQKSRQRRGSPQAAKVKSQKDVEQLAKESAKVKKYLAGKKIKKVIYVEGKIINFVVE